MYYLRNCSNCSFDEWLSKDVSCHKINSRYLTNEGIQYLRDYLHLPPEIVPSTLKRQQRPDARPSAGGERRGFGGDRREKREEGDRAAYRRAPGADGADKTGAAGPGSAPMEFVSLYQLYW